MKIMILGCGGGRDESGGPPADHKDGLGDGNCRDVDGNDD
jgi:hypothetical protein